MEKLKLDYSFSREKTNLVKSILPVLIILHHCYFFDGMSFMGAFGVTFVAFFFLISGYGLMSSYLKYKDAYFKDFISKRLGKLIIPYVFCLLTYVCFATLVKKQSIANVFETDVSHWLPYSWFVLVMFVEYIAFYLSFRNRFSVPRKIFVFSMLCVVYIIIGMCSTLPRIWYASSYAMLIGLIWKFNENLVKYIVYKYKFIIIIASPLLMVIFSVLGVKIFNSLFTCSVYIVLLYCLKERIYTNNRLIHLLSQISYEMYLIQGVAIQLVSNIWGVKYTIIAIPSIILIDIALSYLINKILSSNYNIQWIIQRFI